MSADWKPWDGGECPVDRETRVDVRLRGGGDNEYVKATACDWRYFDRPLSSDIIAYRIHSPAPAPTPSPDDSAAVIAGLMVDKTRLAEENAELWSVIERINEEGHGWGQALALEQLKRRAALAKHGSAP